MSKRYGFTLAEVLITLGIIGVVAAMTIPTLMNQTGEVEYKTAFKKMVSTLNQAVTMSVALDGNDFNTTSTDSVTTNTTSLYALFMNRMNVIKSATDTGGIGASTTNFTLFFSDGMAISIPNTAQACTAGNQCKILVDVNGAKKPNTSVATTATTGFKDQFSMRIYDQQAVPGNSASRYVLYN